jgi:hypothetical protein
MQTRRKNYWSTFPFSLLAIGTACLLMGATIRSSVQDRTDFIDQSVSAAETGLDLHQDELAFFPALSEDAWNDNDILVTDLAYNEVNPSLVCTGDGELYVAVERLDDSRIVIYRSTNNGQSWASFFSWADTETATHNPSIAYIETSSEKWVCVVYERVNADGTRTVQFLRINPENTAEYGVSSVQSNINMTSTGDHIFPRVATDNRDNSFAPDLYLTYALYGADYYRVYFTKSTDKGLNWASPVNVTGSAENSSSPTQPDIAYGSSGLFITFTKLGQVDSSTSWYNQVFVAKSANSGEDWAAPIQLTTDEYHKYNPRVAVSHGDTSSVLIGYTLHWKDETYDDTDVESYSSTDGGSVWAGPFLLPGLGSSNEKDVDLAVSPDQGYFHAAYWQDYSIVHAIASISFPASWSDEVLVDEKNKASDKYTRPSVAVNPTLAQDEEAAVVWSDTRNAFDSVYFDSPFSPVTGTFLPAIYQLLLLND